MSSGEGLVKRGRFCGALGREVTVIEAYSFHGSGACPVGSALSDLSCDGEPECRKKGLYRGCDLWEEYRDFFG